MAETSLSSKMRSLFRSKKSASEAVVMAEASKSGGDGGEELDELLDSIDEMEAERVRRRRSSWLKSVVPIEDDNQHAEQKEQAPTSSVLFDTAQSLVGHVLDDVRPSDVNERPNSSVVFATAQSLVGHVLDDIRPSDVRRSSLPDNNSSVRSRSSTLRRASIPLSDERSRTASYSVRRSTPPPSDSASHPLVRPDAARVQQRTWHTHLQGYYRPPDGATSKEHPTVASAKPPPERRQWRTGAIERMAPKPIAEQHPKTTMAKENTRPRKEKWRTGKRQRMASDEKRREKLESRERSDTTATVERRLSALESSKRSSPTLERVDRRVEAISSSLQDLKKRLVGSTKKRSKAVQSAESGIDKSSANSQTPVGDTRRSVELRKQNTPAIAIEGTPMEQVAESAAKVKEKPAIVESPSDMSVAAEENAEPCLGIVIHRCEHLRPAAFTSAYDLQVMLHVFDEATANYLLKSSPYERMPRAHVEPLLTRPVPNDGQGAAGAVLWDDLLVIDESFAYLSERADIRPLLLFEIVCYVSKASAVSNSAHTWLRRLGGRRGAARHSSSVTQLDSGWYSLAFAFLHLVAWRRARQVNVGEQQRLQLYRTPDSERHRAVKSLRSPARNCFLWYADKSKRRVGGGAALTVSTRRLDKVETVPQLRSFNARQDEHGVITYRQLMRRLALQEEAQEEERETVFSAPSAITASMRTDSQPLEPLAPLANTTWSEQQHPATRCQVPESAFLALSSAELGCCCIKFAPSGSYLVAACVSGAAGVKRVSLVVYSLPEGRRVGGSTTAHHERVYSLDFARDGDSFASASADHTVKTWSLRAMLEGDGARALKTMPHGGYVYAALFYPHSSTLVFSGGFDQLVRLFDLSGKGERAVQLCRLEGHSGGAHVNALAFGRDAARLYSGDSGGQVSVWRRLYADGTEWRLEQRVSAAAAEPTAGDVPPAAVSDVKYDARSDRLVVLTQDSLVRQLQIYNDKSTCEVKRRFRSCVCERQLCRLCITPCGQLLLGGGEDGHASCWALEDARLLLKWPVSPPAAICSIDYHPLAYMAAFACNGEFQPIRLFRHRPGQQVVAAAEEKATESAVAISEVNKVEDEEVHDSGAMSELLLKMDEITDKLRRAHESVSGWKESSPTTSHHRTEERSTANANSNSFLDYSVHAGFRAGLTTQEQRLMADALLQADRLQERRSARTQSQSAFT